MADVLGFNTLLSVALPTGVDGAKVAQFRLKDGLTYAEWAAETAAGIAAFNQSMMDRWGWMFYVGEDDFLEYPNGGASDPAQEITGQDKPRPKRGSTIGHMIDLRVYGEAVGGSKRDFRNLRRSKLDADVRRLVGAFRMRFEQRLMARLMTNTENQIGTSGYDVPFVRGTGGNVDYTPPAYDGAPFTSAHDHYIGYDSGSKTLADMLNGLAATLQEHGHEPPYDAIVSRADAATYRALTSFVEIVDPQIVLVDKGGATTGANYYDRTTQREMGVIGGFQSDYGYVQVRATNRLATGYAGMCRSYGTNDPRNPLYVRVFPGDGFGARVVPEYSGDEKYPIQAIIAEMEYGVSVGEDRTAGAAGLLVSGGAWANPTIS